MGFNGVRKHQKIEDPRFLYWCDRLGVLVWGEAANAFQFDERAAQRLWDSGRTMVASSGAIDTPGSYVGWLAIATIRPVSASITTTAPESAS